MDALIVWFAVSAVAGPNALAGDSDAGRSQDRYGRELTIARNVGIGPTMAACVVDDVLYAIGSGRLHVFDISRPANPQILGRIDGLGNTRQIVVEAGVAYVTSREHGVYVVDVRLPRKPELLSHYDAIEVATGVDVSGDVLAVACRLHGVEFVDVSDPRKPAHLGTARTGEAQSVAFRDGYAYVGVWGTSELVVVDARNPREPTITARCPLDGYGDGVAVRGRHVLVATGHHSRAKRKSSPQEGDPGFGCGHGLEIFEVSDPAKPALVSRIKTPPFYRIGMDMWSVKVAGDYAFVADTYNGLFVVDVADPKRPSFVAHRQLAHVERHQLPGPVGGIALAKDTIYVAGAWTDLHVVEAGGLARPVVPEPDTPPVIPPFAPKSHERFRIYRPNGQVRAVDFLGDTAVVAAGSDGLHLVRLWPEIEKLHRYDTQGFAMGVKVLGDQVFVAEESGGLSIWRRSAEGALSPIGRYRPERGVVRDAAVPAGGKYAIVQVDLSVLEIVDVSDPAAPKRVFRDTGHGFLYHIGEDLIDDRAVCILWQLGGLRWYDIYSESGPTFSGDQYPHRLGGDGTVPLDGDRLVVTRGGLLRIKRGELRPPEELSTYRVESRSLKGRPRLEGDLVYLADRRAGDVSVVDLSNPERPELVEALNVPGN
ncbi:MAG: hypothetical protein ABIK89_18310, partial [Planctomycetota bacterium]